MGNCFTKPKRDITNDLPRFTSCGVPGDQFHALPYRPEDAHTRPPSTSRSNRLSSRPPSTSRSNRLSSQATISRGSLRSSLPPSVRSNRSSRQSSSRATSRATSNGNQNLPMDDNVRGTPSHSRRTSQQSSGSWEPIIPQSPYSSIRSDPRSIFNSARIKEPYRAPLYWLSSGEPGGFVEVTTVNGRTKVIVTEGRQ